MEVEKKKQESKKARKQARKKEKRKKEKTIQPFSMVYSSFLFFFNKMLTAPVTTPMLDHGTLALNTERYIMVEHD